MPILQSLHAGRPAPPAPQKPSFSPLQRRLEHAPISLQLKKSRFFPFSFSSLGLLNMGIYVFLDEHQP
jgi:hypothetical protein